MFRVIRLDPLLMFKLRKLQKIQYTLSRAENDLAYIVWSKVEMVTTLFYHHKEYQDYRYLIDCSFEDPVTIPDDLKQEK